MKRYSLKFREEASTLHKGSHLWFVPFAKPYPWGQPGIKTDRIYFKYLGMTPCHLSYVIIKLNIASVQPASGKENVKYVGQIIRTLDDRLSSQFITEGILQVATLVPSWTWSASAVMRPFGSASLSALSLKDI